MSKKIARPEKRVSNLSKKLIIVPAALLIALSSLAVGSKYEKEIKQVLFQPTVNQTGTNIKVLPKDGEVKRVVDGDTIALRDGTMVRYQGITSPERGEPYFQEATDTNTKLVGDKKVKLEYDAYTSDKFGRVLAYVVVGDKNLSIELVKQGLAKVVILEDRRKLIYQERLLKAQEKAQALKLGMWK